MRNCDHFACESAGLLSPLDRLCWVGHQGMGALSYEPANCENATILSPDLDKIASEIANYQMQESDRYVDELLTLCGSSAGARPKVLLNIANAHWLIKFKSSLDPKDIGPIEYAYHLMAIAAGLTVPEAKLFPAKKGPGFFGVKRFDRQDNKRIHMHTIAGLLHVDHREHALDYATIMKVTWHLTGDMLACRQQFRNAVFNVLSHNRDDHGKNFSFIMDKQGVWQVSPAYDLTFSFGPNGERSTTCMGEGKNPQRVDLLKLASLGEIKPSIALEIIAQVSSAIRQWKIFAKQAGVSRAQTQIIGEALTLILKNQGEQNA